MDFHKNTATALYFLKLEKQIKKTHNIGIYKNKVMEIFINITNGCFEFIFDSILNNNYC